jgi:hypothetical protein
MASSSGSSVFISLQVLGRRRPIYLKENNFRIQLGRTVRTADVLLLFLLPSSSSLSP